MAYTNHTHRPQIGFLALSLQAFAGFLGLVTATVFSCLPANAAGWPTTMQPAVWLEQPAIFTLLVGCGIVLLALMAWKWLARSSNKAAEEKTAIEDFWLRLNWNLSSAKSFNNLLDSVLCLLVEKYQARRGFVSIVAQKDGLLRPVATIGGSPNEADLPAAGSLAKSIFNSCISSGDVSLVTDLKDDPQITTRWLVIPVTGKDKTLALIVLAGEGLKSSNALDISEVDVIQGVISTAAVSFLAGAIGSIQQVSARTSGALSDALAGCNRVQEGLKRASRLINSICPMDFISLSRFDPESGDEIRWSATVDGSRLADWQFPILPHMKKDLPAGNRQLLPGCDYDLAADPCPEAVFETCRGMRSRIVLPILDGNRLAASLTLAHHQPGKYNEATLAQLVCLRRVLAQWLRRRDAVVLSRRDARYLDLLNWLQEPLEKTRRDILPMMRQALAVTAVRLFRYNPAGQTFSLTESSSCRPNGESELRGQDIPAGSLSFHRRAVNKVETCTVDQADPERAMSAEESELVRLGRFRTGMLVPIGDREDVRGVLSVTEMRHPARRRLAGSDNIFLRCAAPRLSALLTDNRATEDRRQIRSALTTPLTTLSGSVELIRRHEEVIDPSVDHYLTNIERATERIKEFAQGAPR